MNECEDCGQPAVYAVTLAQEVAGDDFPRLLCAAHASRRQEDGDAVSVSQLNETSQNG